MTKKYLDNFSFSPIASCVTKIYQLIMIYSIEAIIIEHYPTAPFSMKSVDKFIGTDAINEVGEFLLHIGFQLIHKHI